MRLESAINTAREGAISHGAALSVTGNNITNVNTTAYKGQRTEFVDMISDDPGERGTETVGGGGDGVAIGRVRADFTVGSTTETGRDLDAALTGNGFFIVGDPLRPQLTRSGNFQINAQGILTTAQGAPVLGYKGANPNELQQINMLELNVIPAATTQVTIYGNLDGKTGVSTPPVNPTEFRQLSESASFISTQSIYDSGGDRHDVQLFYFKTGVNSWTAQAYVNGDEVGQGANQPVLLGQTNFTFNAQGRIDVANAAAASININPAWSNGAQQSPLVLSLGNMSQYFGSSVITNMFVDGNGLGEVLSYKIDPQGRIFGNLDNGQSVEVATLGIGLVNSVDGLEQAGGGVYSVTEQSGEIRIGAANGGGRGEIRGEALEQANVDLTTEFVEMIVLQRGYQASTQVFSAANDLLKNTIALIR
jgi:flagellar hook protein FlgE